MYLFMIKSIFFTLLLCVFCTNIFGQKKQNVYLVTNTGKFVESLDSAHFVRIISEPDSGSVLYNLYEYFKNDTKKTVGKVRSFDNGLVYEGNLVEFYESGFRKSAKQYNNGALDGDVYFYHKNGKMASHWIYSQNSNNSNYMVGKGSLFMGKAKLMMKQDSLGIVMIKDGDGYDVSRDEYKEDTLVAKGNYKNGFKDGEWKGEYIIGKQYFYVEHYRDGKLISGESTYNGIKYQYDNLEAPQLINVGKMDGPLFLLIIFPIQEMHKSGEFKGV